MTSSWFFLSTSNCYILLAFVSSYCNVYYQFPFSIKLDTVWILLTSCIREANSLSPLPGKQIPLRSIRCKCIEPRLWRESSLYCKECLFSVLSLHNWVIGDDSALTVRMNIYRSLRTSDATYWRQYIVKDILLCWPCCAVFLLLNVRSCWLNLINWKLWHFGAGIIFFYFSTPCI